jgi:hypothetical protein
MPVVKVSLSLEADVVAEARAESGGNLSAYVNEALEARMRNRSLRQTLDEFRHEFTPLPPEEEAAFRQQAREAFARVEAGAAALEETLVRAQSALDEHPLVDEAVVTLGPLQTPVAYVVLTEERQPLGALAAELREHLRRSLDTGWEVHLVLVPGNPAEPGTRSRPILPGVVPL